MKLLLIFFRLIQMWSAGFFVFRILGHLHQHHLMNKKYLTKMGTGLIFLIFIISSLPLPHEIWRWCFLWLSLGCSYIIIQLIILQREKQFQDKFISVLDRLLILIRTGLGLRTALDRIVDSENGFTRAKLTQLRSSVVFSQHINDHMSDSKLGEIIRELRCAHHFPHEAIRRIENLRRKIKFERNFRHKSGQVLFQMKIQTWILTVLYGCLMLWVLRRDFHSLDFLWFLFSLLLFLTGFFWCQILGRKIKWKI